jgi:hypothetical protein
MTDSGGDHAHAHFIDPRLLQVQFLDAGVRLAGPRHCCLDFHYGRLGLPALAAIRAGASTAVHFLAMIHPPFIF